MWRAQLWRWRSCRHVTPRQSIYWSQLCHFTAILLPSNQCTNNHRMHNYTSHPAACLLLAVSHSCTNTQCIRRQRLSNLNRTSAFVYESLNHHRCVCSSCWNRGIVRSNKLPPPSTNICISGKGRCATWGDLQIQSRGKHQVSDRVHAAIISVQAGNTAQPQ